MASITSSSDLASEWMSSRSMGVTNVRFRRWMISCVSVSQSCSTCLNLMRPAPSPAGRRRASARAGRQPGDELVGQGDEVGVELLFAGNEAKAGHTAPWVRTARILSELLRRRRAGRYLHVTRHVTGFASNHWRIRPSGSRRETSGYNDGAGRDCGRDTRRRGMNDRERIAQIIYYGAVLLVGYLSFLIFQPFLVPLGLGRRAGGVRLSVAHAADASRRAFAGSAPLHAARARAHRRARSGCSCRCWSARWDRRSRPCSRRRRRPRQPPEWLRADVALGAGPCADASRPSGCLPSISAAAQQIGAAAARRDPAS